MTKMKSWIVMAVLLGAVQPAFAGRIFLFAESATCNTGETDCAKTYVTGVFPDQYAYIGVQNTAPFTHATWPMAIPPDAAAATVFTYRIHYETPDTGTTKVCSFNIGATSFPNGAPAVTSGGAPLAVATSAAVTHVAARRYITAASGSTAVWNMSGTPGNCAASACLNTSAVVETSNNTALTTATSCRIRMIEVIY